jgi:hypothetical protein
MGPVTCVSAAVAGNDVGRCPGLAAVGRLDERDRVAVRGCRLRPRVRPGRGDQGKEVVERAARRDHGWLDVGSCPHQYAPARCVETGNLTESSAESLGDVPPRGPAGRPQLLTRTENEPVCALAQLIEDFLGAAIGGSRTTRPKTVSGAERSSIARWRSGPC